MPKGSMYSHDYNADNLQEKINAYIYIYISALISYNKTKKKCTNKAEKTIYIRIFYYKKGQLYKKEFKLLSY